MSVRMVAISFVGVGLLGLVFGSGMVLGARYPALVEIAGTASPQSDQSKRGQLRRDEVNFDLFWEVWDLIQLRHVDRPGDPDELLYGAINGMMQYGFKDEFSTFLPPEIHSIATDDLSGSFGGVGIELEMIASELTIVAPLSGTPGEAAGLLAGDVISHIDGEETIELTILESVQKIRGEIGTTVMLSIFRVTEEGTVEEFDVEVERAVIDVESVRFEDMGEGIYKISVRNFAMDTIGEWDRVVSEILKNDVRGIILDLRNNGGGVVHIADHIISEFVSEGVAVIQDHGQGRREETRVSGLGRLTDVPVKVLINRGTASASEMVAGALQDYERAQLYGTRTFGKGVIQQVFTLDVPGMPGQQASARIVSTKWYTPLERSINREGLSPDIEIQTTTAQREAGEDPVLDQALADFGE